MKMFKASDQACYHGLSYRAFPFLEIRSVSGFKQALALLSIVQLYLETANDDRIHSSKHFSGKLFICPPSNLVLCNYDNQIS